MMLFNNNLMLFWYKYKNKGNNYENELSKNGVFSFFSALHSIELDYTTVYKTLPNKEAYQIVKKD